MATKKIQSRRFAVTLWDIEVEPYLCDWMQYFCAGLETCQDGKLHYQCYVETHTKRTEGGVAVLLRKAGWERCWTSAARASIEANVEYCKGLVEKKQNNPNEKVWEIGQAMTQGERTDLMAIRDKLVAGESLDDLVYDNPNSYHVYGRTMEKLAKVCANRLERRKLVHAEWRWGPTGTGKSYEARLRKPYEWEYGEKFQTYRGEDTILFDEMRKGCLGVHQILKYTDKDAKNNIMVKGEHAIPMNVSHIYFTSPHHPKEVLEFEGNDKFEQFERRVKITHCNEVYKE